MDGVELSVRHRMLKLVGVTFTGATFVMRAAPDANGNSQKARAAARSGRDHFCELAPIRLLVGIKYCRDRKLTDRDGRARALQPGLAFAGQNLLTAGQNGEALDAIGFEDA